MEVLFVVELHGIGCGGGKRSGGDQNLSAVPGLDLAQPRGHRGMALQPKLKKQRPITRINEETIHTI
jgi:hypothetical protein